jgi:hypothetical protein
VQAEVLVVFPTSFRCWDNISSWVAVISQSLPTRYLLMGPSFIGSQQLNVALRKLRKKGIEKNTGYMLEELQHLVYNGTYVESHQTFQRNMLPPSSGLNEQSRKPA